ncbi:MAG: adenosylmethionine--8-amino-7-oxononanoate transaminase [Crocinitomicaceae bacterium]|nr:adenosylmethionine--8-amino-7-oxononanoate transaminase [Crocinitomicaceae bacterium]|tara:strand:+ start:113343 stop:114620 length:1278 start_codon:yes stop_codon:yes gene_type:complete
MSSILEKDKKYVWHPFTQHFNSEELLEIVKAEGVFLYDSSGKKYIDANSSWWVNIHGHGNKYIGEAIVEQFNKIDHIVFAGLTHLKAVELAKRITKILPTEMEKVFFSDNGSTSVEIGLKMIIQYWHNKGIKKNRFLAMRGSYHGDTFGAMSIGQRGYFNVPFEPFFFDVDYIDFPNKFNEDSILSHSKSLFETGDFAGMILEPLVQGASGMRMYSPLFLDRLATLAKDNDVLIIYDEVMTGFGRTGKMFATDYCQVKPDIITLSKGLTAGVMPLGLTVTSNRIYNAFLGEETTKALLHGHSFTANPIACAVACANLDLFEQPITIQCIQNLELWNQEFKLELEKIECVNNIRQQGTIIAFDVLSEEGNTYFSDIKTKAYKYFLSQGVLLRPLGNVIFINPPLIISKEEYNKITKAILRFLKDRN